MDPNRSSDVRPRVTLPKSVSSFGINVIGCATVVAVLFVLRSMHKSGSDAVLILCAAGVLPILLLDVFVLKVHRRATAGLDWDSEPRSDWRRFLTKLLGLALTVAPFALAYACFDEYHYDPHHPNFFDPWYNVLHRFWLPLVVGALFYVYFVDERMRPPKDAYWQIGRWALGHREDLDKKEIANHYRAWLVKAFYLPLFVVYIHGQLNGLLTWNLASASMTNTRFYDFCNDLVYGLDVLYACVGYVALAPRHRRAHAQRRADDARLGRRARVLRAVLAGALQPHVPALRGRRASTTWLGGHLYAALGVVGADRGVRPHVYVLATVRLRPRASRTSRTAGFSRTARTASRSTPRTSRRTSRGGSSTVPFVVDGELVDERSGLRRALG